MRRCPVRRGDDLVPSKRVLRPGPTLWPVVDRLEGRTLFSAGDPDLSFGTAGAAHVDLNLPGYAFGRSLDVRGGKTVVVGVTYHEGPFSLVLARYTSAGLPDPSFGGGDGVVVREGYDLWSSHAMRVAADGKVLVVAKLSDNFVNDVRYLLRFNADGSPDATFGTGGVARMPFKAETLAIAADGSNVWVAGSSGGRFALASIGPGGSPNPGFAGGGFVTVPSLPGSATAMTLTAAGKPVLAGNTENLDGSPTAPALARFRLTGALDTGFGSAGVVRLDTATAFADVAIAANNQVVVAATRGSDLEPVRLNDAGQVNKVFTRLSPALGTRATDVRVASDGKVVVFAGEGRSDPDGPEIGYGGGSYVARYNVDGTLDQTFAPGLGFRVAAGPRGDLTAENKVVAGGQHLSFDVGRYLAADPSDPSGISLAADGTLTVNGTGGNDTIRIMVRQLTPGGPTTWRVRVNGFYRGFNRDLVARVVVNAGAGNDLVDLRRIAKPTTVSGGDGNDLITGGTGVDTIDGGAGNDTLSGVDGADKLTGGSGDDRLNGGPGADDLSGGTGVDTLDYAGRSGAQSVSLDNVAGDGLAGENDNARADNEVIVGGGGNDTFVGNAAANKIYGNGGADTLRGGGGNDLLVGGAGLDKLFGDGDDDTLDARDGNAGDLLDGGPGHDLALTDAGDTKSNTEG